MLACELTVGFYVKQMSSLFFCSYRSDSYREEGTHDEMNRLTNPALFNETPGHLQTRDHRTRYFLMSDSVQDISSHVFL